MCITLLLCSCSITDTPNVEDTQIQGGTSNTTMKEDEGKLASARLEQILIAIEQQDFDTISSMFSEAVLASTDVSTGKDYLFSLIDGDVSSCEKIGGNVSEDINQGKKVVNSKYRFFVYTENSKYLFSITECLSDTDHPENIGLFSIKALKIADNSEEPAFTDPGIYIPQ